ncbi:MFS transporter, UMF1 family [Mucilaginibacter lappiensis]|uniref:UMF1 family MFS transporter n=1 Tax=Mucilaginibacter lappiensis TaxID=354630 RepID=A0ABR6PEN1_9SPHI|nr:MFS transporter [Mucilaginibacter lappiensis]MBB6108058.1 UMF1 family MFS transporter [Mucilaginibacter lappiensis]SIP88438.1 MFS transporter, UMF1 family [Mucilaginibacter lappiensis]
METKNNKKTIRAWAFFDWANSAYNLVITSTIFPAYYVAITKANGGRVTFFGKSFVNTALSDYALSVAYLIIVLLLPILSSIADYKGNKKIFMQFFTAIGALACGVLYFFDANHIELGIIAFALAAIGYSGGFVFYNSYLPEIATVDMQDNVSAKGFTYGYIGSVLLQLICFVFVLKPELFGIVDQTFPARLSFLLVGVWWMGFALIPFIVLPKGSPNAVSHDHNIIKGGFIELGKVWKKVKTMPLLKRYLPAFFFYSMGVQTIMLVATGFAAKELHMPTSALITTILIIQLVAIGGATLMSRLSGRYGNVRVLIAVVIIWIGVCAAAYLTTTATQFYVVAAVVGLVMGGIQSMSRSTYSKYLPENITDTASFFSFYDVTEKLAIVGGVFSFGFFEELTGSPRNSVLVLAIFFIIGLILLFSLLSAEKKVKQNAELSAV